ncbi:hypothetical protein [Bacillus cereus]|uniref:Uncharacterized protein n=1 Tax=Bacillus cereus TaxID=1396 RepID=A0A2B9DHH1_BACCE|nr:hypothetical protein [Bacillus cereus]PGM88005.1 hypothetical protein CN958_27740 [Bacillus cereus]
MKKIQLTDGMPTNVKRVDLKPKTIELLEKIKEECTKSDLSYVEMNKALHVADEELYISVINCS